MRQARGRVLRVWPSHHTFDACGENLPQPDRLECALSLSGSDTSLDNELSATARHSPRAFACGYQIALIHAAKTRENLQRFSLGPPAAVTRESERHPTAPQRTFHIQTGKSVFNQTENRNAFGTTIPSRL